MKSLCLLLLLVAVVPAALAKTGKGKVCKLDSECQQGECCQIMRRFQIVSKRNFLFPDLKKPRQGTCEPYSREGESCDVFAKPNGFCSCEPGTHCTSHQVKISTSTIKGDERVSRLTRRRIAVPKPGYKREGDSCAPFAKANGFCSCEAGTKCKSFEVKLSDNARGVATATPVTPEDRRRDMVEARPGYRWIDRCTRE